MSAAREQILGAIRRALGRTTVDEHQRRELAARLDRPPQHLRPQVEDDLLARFTAQLRAVSTELVPAEGFEPPT